MKKYSVLIGQSDLYLTYYLRVAYWHLIRNWPHTGHHSRGKGRGDGGWSQLVAISNLTARCELAILHTTPLNQYNIYPNIYIFFYDYMFPCVSVAFNCKASTTDPPFS